MEEGGVGYSGLERRSRSRVGRFGERFGFGGRV